MLNNKKEHVIEKSGHDLAWYHPAFIAALIAGVGLFLWVAWLGENIPVADEYPDALGFLVDFLASSDPQHRLKILFSVDAVNAVTLLTHLVYLLQWFVIGEIDFKQQQYLGFFNIIGIGTVVFFTYYRQLGYRLLFTLIGLLLFHAQFGEGLLWAMAGINNYGVITLTLFAFFIFCQPRKTWIEGAGFFLGFLASQAMPNGLFVWPLLAIYCFKNKERPVYYRALCGVFFLVSAIPHALHLMAGTDGMALMHEGFNAVSHAVMLPFAYLVVSGSIASPGAVSIVVAAVFGLLLNAWFLWLLWQRKAQPFWLMSMGFLWASMLLIAAGRYSADHPEAAQLLLSSRYKLYSAMFALLLLLETLCRKRPIQRNQKMIGAILVLAVIFNGTSWFLAGPNDVLRQQEYRKAMNMWLLTGKPEDLGFTTLLTPDADGFINAAVEKGLYRPFSVLKQDKKLPAFEVAQCSRVPEHNVNISMVRMQANLFAKTRGITIYISGWDAFSSPPAIVLCGEQNAYRLILSDQQWVPLQVDNARMAEVFVLPEILLPKGPSPAWGEYRVFLEYPAKSGSLFHGNNTAMLDWRPIQSDVKQDSH
ncbi:MAG TPA: hypothetical protein VIM96_03735 [Pseudomonadales bacterium]